jgi:hypothetical protein
VTATAPAARPAPPLAGLPAAIAAWRAAGETFAATPGTGGQLRDAEAAMRRAGLDPDTGLITLPAAAVRFTDTRADGARMRAVCGSRDGQVWVCWHGRALPCGIETRTYGPDDLIQIRGAQ